MATTRNKKSSTSSRRGSSTAAGSKSGRGGAARSGAGRTTGRSGGKGAASRASASSGSSSRGQTTRTSNTGQMTTNHRQIRRWVEERGGKPACVLGTGGRGDQGLLRIDFPGYTGAQSLQHISWDEWFEKFDESNLALLYQDNTSGGQRSNFNKLVDRNQAKGGRGGRGGGGKTGKTKSRSKTTGRHGRSS